MASITIRNSAPEVKNWLLNKTCGEALVTTEGRKGSVTLASNSQVSPTPSMRKWWRRRELNPRPSVLCLQLYMLRFRLLI